MSFHEQLSVDDKSNIRLPIAVRSTVVVKRPEETPQQRDERIWQQTKAAAEIGAAATQSSVEAISAAADEIS